MSARSVHYNKMTDASQLGFANLPFLAHRKSVKKGFEFTLMVVGKLGSLTIINYCDKKMYNGTMVIK